jgi:hypothetical protein
MRAVVRGCRAGAVPVRHAQFAGHVRHGRRRQLQGGGEFAAWRPADCSRDTASALRARSASISATLASRRVSSPALRRLATACAVLSNSSTERCSSCTRRCAASTAWKRRDASARAWRRASSISARKASSDADAASRRRACWPPISIGCAMPRPHSRALPSGVAALRRVRSTLSSGLLKSSDACFATRCLRRPPAGPRAQRTAGLANFGQPQRLGECQRARARGLRTRGQRSRQPARRPAPGKRESHRIILLVSRQKRFGGDVEVSSVSPRARPSPRRRRIARQERWNGLDQDAGGWPGCGSRNEVLAAQGVAVR